MRNLILILALVVSLCPLMAQQEAVTVDGQRVVLYKDGSWRYALTLAEVKPVKIDSLEMPGRSDGAVVCHAGYILSYNEDHEQADWVAYELTKKEIKGKFKRTNKFIVDSSISTGSATGQDYKKSGYDQGHLAPAADMAWSKTAMKESFYYSNMSPQSPGFNRNIWKKLEEYVRNWALDDKAVYVVTGPVLIEGLPAIGPNKVSVPKYYYKVILDYTLPEIKGIGFILPNAGSTESLKTFAVTIDSVEKFTGIDFFYRLPDDQESVVEESIDTGAWFKK